MNDLRFQTRVKKSMILMVHLYSILELEHDLKGSKMYRQNFKRLVNGLLSEIEKSMDIFMGDLSESELTEITEQFINLSKVIDIMTLVTIQIQLDKGKAAVIELNNQMKMLFQKFGGEETKKLFDYLEQLEK